jgi:membrane-associated protease RseP (regulator of RpoE activity)
MNEGPHETRPFSPEPQRQPSMFATSDVVVPQLPEPERPYLTEEMLLTPKRRVAIPVALFILACFSTFWAGATIWSPHEFGLSDLRLAIVANWRVGLTYMGCIIGILMFHEMGHFLMTVRFGIPASLPYFIPFPYASPIGTMGAVIAMAGYRANRRQTFDIGIAGPLAGLVIALPILLFGVKTLDLSQTGYGSFAVDCPLLVRLMIRWLRPEHAHVTHIWVSQMNPFFMAAWVGLLITGLNMVPISQLDGGHVTYTLFGKWAHWIARGFLIFVLAYIVIARAYMWTLMVVLVTLIGTDHPPTANDHMPLGRGRYILGLVSLVIPALCFPPRGFVHLF